MMNCIIVDDDELTLMEVESFVKRTPGLSLMQTFTNPVEAFNYIMTNKPDLIFLDIMMPQMSGLDLLKILQKDAPQIIFMTLKQDYASDAFDFEVTDFLAKPITQERFNRAVEKAKHIYESSKKVQVGDDYIFLKVKNNFVKIKLDDITYMESSQDYINVHTISQGNQTTLSTLKAMQDKLPPNDFIRVHNSFIVRLDKITRIEDNSILIGEAIIPLSRMYKEELLGRLNKVG
jgi:two-component system LytT family response regulator